MKKSILLFTLILTASVCFSQVSGKYFCTPRPSSERSSAKFDVKPIVQFSAIKITSPIRENAKLDASFLVAGGGGITIQRIGEKDTKNYSPYSFSPIIILLSGNTADEGAVLDISWCATIGIMNNIVQFGVGYDFGAVPDGANRLFGLISFGVNLTNN